MLVTTPRTHIVLDFQMAGCYIQVARKIDKRYDHSFLGHSFPF